MESRSRLATHAWAMQERVLARRILTIGREEMEWLCDTISRSECQSRSSTPSKQVLQDWATIITTYTERQLTQESDRLPALSGIASAFQGSDPKFVNYACEMWVGSLGEGLLWLNRNCFVAKDEVRH